MLDFIDVDPLIVSVIVKETDAIAIVKAVDVADCFPPLILVSTVMLWR